MKISKLLITTVFLFLFVPAIVRAECTYADKNKLNGLANNVKADFKVEEEIEVIRDTFDGEYKEIKLKKNVFWGNIYNVTDELRLEITNNVTREKTAYTTDDAIDGVISFKSPDSDRLNEYTINVYGGNEDCSESKLRSFNFTLPKNNPYNNFVICEKAPEYYMCQDYVLQDVAYTDGEFIANVKKYIEKRDKKDEPDDKKKKSAFWDFLIKYWYIPGIVIIIGGATVGTIVIIRRRRIV